MPDDASRSDGCSGDPGAWPIRVAWVALPLLAGPSVAGALGDVSAPVRWSAAIGLWAVWTVVLIAVLVPRAVGLTAVRAAAPGAIATAVWATLVGDPDVGDAVALAATALASVAGLASFTADAFVDGSSYGNERRFSLRTPLGVVLGAAPVTWAIGAAGPVAGVLLLATRRWLLAAVALGLGLPIAVAAARRLHQLSRRWVVLVPAGVVLHDPLALADPVLFPRNVVADLGPATATDLGEASGIDVSGGAPGLAVALRLRSPTTVPLITGRGATREERVDRVVFTPGRPGALIAEARRRRLPIA